MNINEAQDILERSKSESIDPMQVALAMATVEKSPAPAVNNNWEQVRSAMVPDVVVPPAAPTAPGVTNPPPPATPIPSDPSLGKMNVSVEGTPGGSVAPPVAPVAAPPAPAPVVIEEPKAAPTGPVASGKGTSKPAKETAYSGFGLQNADEPEISPEEKAKRQTYNEGVNAKVDALINTEGGIDKLKTSKAWFDMKPKDREDLQIALNDKAHKDTQDSETKALNLDLETSQRLANASAPERAKLQQQIAEREGGRRELWAANQQYLKDAEKFKTFRIDHDKTWKEAGVGDRILAVLIGGLGGGGNYLVDRANAYVAQEMYYWKKFGEGLDKQKAGIETGNKLLNDTQESQTADWLAQRELYGTVIDKLTGAKNLATDPVKKVAAEDAIKKLQLKQEIATKTYKNEMIMHASKTADAQRLAQAKAQASAAGADMKALQDAKKAANDVYFGANKNPPVDRDGKQVPYDVFLRQQYMINRGYKGPTGITSNVGNFAPSSSENINKETMWLADKNKELTPVKSAIQGVTKEDLQNIPSAFFRGLRDGVLSDDPAPMQTQIANWLLTNKENQSMQKVGNALSLYVKMISGAASTDKENVRLAMNLLGTGRPEDVALGLRNLNTIINSVEKNYRAGVSPEAVKEYDRRLGDQPASSPAEAGGRQLNF